MKRFLMIAVLVTALMALFAGAALAAGPVGLGRGQGATLGTGDPATCPMGGAGAGTMAGRPQWAGQPDAVAELLGLTAEEIQAERQDGKSLAQIAANQGVSVDKLVETILAEKKDVLTALVADGKLTQAQADAMIARMQTQVQTAVERTTTGPMNGRGQGMGATRMGRGMNAARGWHNNTNR